MLFSITPFFNELDVLEIRLATLDPVVDVHVIAESPVTHTGLEKPLYFDENRERFKPWAHKIRHLVVEDMPGEDWEREAHQRASLLRGIEVLPTDRFLLSDVDEIPHPDAVRQADDPQLLLCRMFVGRLNWAWPGAEEGWSISRTFTGADLDRQGGDLHMVRLARWPSNPLLPVGWHLSYMADIPEKLAGFAHQEMVADADLDAMVRGDDLFGRERKCEWVGLDALPPYVAVNRDRFAHLLVDKP